MKSVDISEIPPDKLDRPDLLNLKKEMELALSKTAWIKAFCIHEAGHMTYFRQLGITEYEFEGPRITYNAEKDCFDGYMASVKPKAAPASNDIGIVTVAAKAYVAGLVFTRKLTNTPDSGEQEDRQNFNALCEMVENHFKGPTIDREDSWKQAESDVSADLRSPQFRTEAWKTAQEIEETIFGS